MLAHAQYEGAIAIDGDDIGVAARHAVFTNQPAVKDSVGYRFEVQLGRQIVTVKPAGFDGFNAGRLLCARQRVVIIAGRIADFLLQRIERVERFFLLHFVGNVVTHVSQRFHYRRLNVIQTHDQEAHGGFDHARQLAFLFQASIFQFVHSGGLFHPAEVAAVTGRDDIRRLLFRQRGEISAFVQFVQNCFGIRFGLALNHAVAVTLRLGELILMLVIVRLDIVVRDVLAHCCCIQLDVADAELFRRHELPFVLLVVAGNFLIAHLLFCRQGVDVDSRFTDQALLGYQCRQLVGFARQHEVGTGYGVNQLLSG